MPPNSVALLAQMPLADYNFEDMAFEKVAQRFGLSEADLQRYCDRGHIRLSDLGNKRYIFDDQFPLLELITTNSKAREMLPVMAGSFMVEYHPELIEYLGFHGIIDVISWMTKLRYSSREAIKRRRYSLPLLFQDFLEDAAFDLSRISRLTGTANSEDRFVFHLAKGWYNELARSVPLDGEYLNISTKTDPGFSRGRTLAWNVTQSYYAVYEYVNALVFTNTCDLHTKEHRRSTRHFNNTLMTKFAGTLVKYPYNITNPLKNDIKVLRQIDKPFWRYGYATYPRDRSRTLYLLEEDLIEVLQPHGSILDALYAFRVWANYLGIHTIIELQEGYFLSHLYENLGLITFFYAAFTEIMALAFLGEEKTVKLLEGIAAKYILRQDNFRANHYLIPMFLRFRLYQRCGLIARPMPFLIPSAHDPLS